MSAPELRATARLQLRREFDLDAAMAQVDYYAALGVSHLYLSPIAEAVDGSAHGYDVTDPTRVSAALGGEAALHRLVKRLRQHGMGAILDIVPNHMATDAANAWWRDVLAHGRESPYADYFDIDWDAPRCEGRLWLAVLEAPLDELLAQHRIGLAADNADRGLELDCAGQRLPLSPASLRHLLMLAGLSVPTDCDQPGLRLACAQALLDPAQAPRLDHLRGYLRQDEHAVRVLLELQHYRLAWWRSGSDMLNYRRFFDISSLVALAIERAPVFEAVHALPLRLIAEGLIDGLRIDHIDGLSRPDAYLRRLRRAVESARRRRPRELDGPVSLHVEKILAETEQLPPWPIDGSTGYDFMDQVGALLHDPAGAAPLRASWHQLSGRPADFAEEEYLARGELLDGSLHTEWRRCTRAWLRLAAHRVGGGDLATHALGQALAEVLRRLRAYRSYLGAGAPSLADRQLLEDALDAADRDGDPDRQEVRAYLRQQLLQRMPRRLAPAAERADLRLARQRLEQIAAPLNAKAVEDTGFYRHGVLLSRNEVGSDPRRFALSAAAFHQASIERARHWPRALLATATHDHKRGEDARARLAVLSERAADTAAWAMRWIAVLRAIDPTPARGDSWMLLQTMLAAWPLGLLADDAAGCGAFAERLLDWQRKALREAKLHTRWTRPDEAYEAACERQLRGLLQAPEWAAQRTELAAAAAALDAPGALNGLVSCTLRLTVPGVPDLYQGGEGWDLSLVDPDNRRPVDYPSRRAALARPFEPAQLLRDYRDGAIKQALIGRLLACRRRAPALFAAGAYQPLALQGALATRALAFERRLDRQRLLVVVPLHGASLLTGDASPLIAGAAWRDTRLAPFDAAATYRDVFQPDRVMDSHPGAWSLARLLADWPVAVLCAE